MYFVTFLITASNLIFCAMGFAEAHSHKAHSHTHKSNNAHPGFTYQKPGAGIRLAHPLSIVSEVNEVKQITATFTLPRIQGKLTLTLAPSAGVVMISQQREWSFALSGDTENETISINLEYYSTTQEVEQLSFHALISSEDSTRTRVLGLAVLPNSPKKNISHKPNFQSKGNVDENVRAMPATESVTQLGNL